MITIAVTNQKGGVGKTTIAFNLAQLSVQSHSSVLAIDNDPQGNLTTSFIENQISPKANILHAYDCNPFEPARISENLLFIG